MKNQFIKLIMILGLGINLLSCSSNEVSYTISTEDVLQFYVDSMKVNSESIISKTEFINLMGENSKNVTYLDVRSAHKFTEYHLANSINHPYTSKFLSEKSIAELNTLNGELFVIGEDSKQAMIAFLLLKQVGFENIKVVLGGVDYAHNIAGTNIASVGATYNDEISKYDYKKLMSESSSKPSSGSSEKKTTRKKVVKREKKAVSGGCG